MALERKPRARTDHPIWALPLPPGWGCPRSALGR